MIKSSASLMAEDVTIRCTVRKSCQVKSTATSPVGGNPLQPLTDTSNNSHSLNNSCNSCSCNGGTRRGVGGGISSSDGLQWMACTMRNWDTHHRNRSSFGGALRRKVKPIDNSHEDSSESSHHRHHHADHGPELLLTPIIEQFFTNHRDESPMRRINGNGTINKPQSQQSRQNSTASTNSSSSLNNSNNNNRSRAESNNTASAESVMTSSQPIMNSVTSTPLTTQCSILVSDIVIAYNFSCTKPPHRIHIVMTSASIYEFENLTDNAYDILLAFLQASIGPERIIDKAAGATPGGTRASSSTGRAISPRRQMTTGGNSSSQLDIRTNHSLNSNLDIDTLQAKHLEGRVRNETWQDKFSRRIGHVVNSLSEFCDFSGACCSSTATNPSSMNNHPMHYDEPINEERRDLPPVSQSNVQSPLQTTTSTTSNNNRSNLTPVVTIEPWKTTPTRMMGTTGFLEYDEMTEATGSVTGSPASNKKYNHQHHQSRNLGLGSQTTESSSIKLLPSGLSVEPNPSTGSNMSHEVPQQ